MRLGKLFYTRTGNRWLVLLTLLSGAGLLALSATGGIRYIVRLFPPCIIRTVTGFLCPGCGVTRATLALLRLEPIEAFRYNPSYTVFLLVAAIWFIWFAANAFSKRYKQPFASKWYPIAGVMLLIVSIGFCILRNLPWFPMWFYR